MNTMPPQWTACLGLDHISRMGMIARWRPVHLGQEPVLRAMCECADHALIGIGSANRYNARNPFTVAETEAMIRLVLRDFDNYEIILVPDLDDGPRWRLMILDMFDDLDVYLTANPYVAQLMHEDYAVAHPVNIVAPKYRVPIEGAQVRRLMAQNENWEALVPKCIASYIQEHNLDDRFREEFGLETLALHTVIH